MIGLVAGYRRGWVDPVLMRAMDVLLAFPPIIFLLLLATGFGNSPRSADSRHCDRAHAGRRAHRPDGDARGLGPRLRRGSGRARRSTLRGSCAERSSRTSPGRSLADAGPRFTVSILLVAAVNFLGLGIAPPTADWALMISENREGITINPLAVLVPALMIGLLTVSLNTLADAFAASLGHLA